MATVAADATQQSTRKRSGRFLKLLDAALLDRRSVGLHMSEINLPLIRTVARAALLFSTTAAGSGMYPSSAENFWPSVSP